MEKKGILKTETKLKILDIMLYTLRIIILLLFFVAAFFTFFKVVEVPFGTVPLICFFDILLIRITDALAKKKKKEIAKLEQEISECEKEATEIRKKLEKNKETVKRMEAIVESCDLISNEMTYNDLSKLLNRTDINNEDRKKITDLMAILEEDPEGDDDLK